MNAREHSIHSIGLTTQAHAAELMADKEIGEDIMRAGLLIAAYNEGRCEAANGKGVAIRTEGLGDDEYRRARQAGYAAGCIEIYRKAMAKREAA